MNTLRNKTDRPHTTYGSTRLALALIAGALLMTPETTQAQIKGSALPVAETLTLADRVMMVTDPSGTPSTKTATLTLIKATLAAGSGDVVGPASAVNNRVAFFDGTTGKLIKDSGLTLSGTNTGDQDLSSYLTSAAAALAYQPLNTKLNLLSALTTSGAGVMKYTNDFGFTAGQLIASDLWNPLGANTVMTFNGSGNGAAITPSAVLDIIGSTRGQVLYRGASGWTVLSPGASGQALTTGGAGADPSWTTVGVSDGDKGSITVSSSGTVWTIDASAVTDSMLAGSISPSKVTGTAAILGANTFSGTQTVPALNYSGNISATGSGYVQTRNFFQVLDASGAANRALIGEAYGARLGSTMQLGWTVGDASLGFEFYLSRASANVLSLTDAFLSSKLRLQTDAAPLSATDTGTVNEVRWDANFIYICTATNTWKRVAIATW